MSDLRAAAKQALEALCLWSAGRDMDAVALNDLIFRLRDALVEDAMQKFTDVNQELEAELSDTKVDSHAIAKLPTEAKHS